MRAGLLAGWLLASGPVSDPARDEGLHVIPPGREAAARELLEAIVVETGHELRWAGPTIEIDRIQWMLLRGDEARARLLLIPRELAEPGDPTSRSFAIQVTWPPEVEPAARERELIDAAVAAVQAGDRGQFYRVRLDLFEPEGQPAPPYQAPLAGDPSEVHRRWGLELGGIALLGLFAIGVTLRPRSTKPDVPTRP